MCNWMWSAETTGTIEINLEVGEGGEERVSILKREMGNLSL